MLMGVKGVGVVACVGGGVHSPVGDPSSGAHVPLIALGRVVDFSHDPE